MATGTLQPTGLKAERRFYLSMGLATLAVVVIGFTPSFYLRGVVPAYEPFLPLTPLVVLHGSLFSAWILFFLSQVSLVSAGRLDLHRRLGAVGALLAGAMIFVGIFTGLHGAIRHSGPPIVPPLSWLAVPLFDQTNGALATDDMAGQEDDDSARLMAFGMASTAGNGFLGF